MHISVHTHTRTYICTYKHYPNMNLKKLLKTKIQVTVQSVAGSRRLLRPNCNTNIITTKHKDDNITGMISIHVFRDLLCLADDTCELCLSKFYIFILQASSQDVKDVWTAEIKHVLLSHLYIAGIKPGCDRCLDSRDQTCPTQSSLYCRHQARM